MKIILFIFITSFPLFSFKAVFKKARIKLQGHQDEANRKEQFVVPDELNFCDYYITLMTDE